MRHLRGEARPRGRRAPAKGVARRWFRLPARARRVLAAGSGLAAAALMGASTWILVASGAIEQAGAAVSGAVARATAGAGFAVAEVYVSGRGRTQPADVLAALGVRVGDPVLFVDLDDGRDRLQALPWVREATVERRLPGVLFVRLVEREPMAVWQHEGGHVVIDRNGEPVAGVDVRPFAHLPLVVGPDAPAHTAQLLAVLATEPALATRVAAAVRMGARRWDLKLDNGLRVALPAGDFAAAWHALAAYERDHRLLEGDVAALDLRQGDKVVVRLTPEGRAAREQAFKEAKGEST